MKLLALTAVAGSLGVFGVAAWDAATDQNHNGAPKQPEAVARAVLQAESASRPVISSETRFSPSSETRFSPVEVASAAVESHWTMRTRDYQDLMFSALPMVAAPAAQVAARTQKPAQRVEKNETVVAVPAGAPVKAATERAKPPQVRPVQDKDSLMMTPARVARIKEALRLTPDQEAHWPKIEVALREIGRQQMEAQKQGVKLPKDALSPEVTQQLYWSAGPLIMSLREDQKSEARSLARSMGLERVASLL